MLVHMVCPRNDIAATIVSHSLAVSLGQVGSVAAEVRFWPKTGCANLRKLGRSLDNAAWVSDVMALEGRRRCAGMALDAHQ